MKLSFTYKINILANDATLILIFTYKLNL